MPSKNTPAAIEATVTSKGQITLPSALRSRLGIHTGSRIRFTLAPTGGFEAHPVLGELEDLWAWADQPDQAGKLRPAMAPVMTFAEMNAAKARRARQ